ncbi:MAG: hypothetical protein HFH85_20825 [Lachnospiraceae bacterium]|jgi:hypothetical protein|nr:hypothetical protein [Lachnospiraceae bacterium]
MATKKSGVQNSEFLKAMREKTDRDSKSVKDVLKKNSVLSVVGNERKSIEYKDVYTMQPAPDDWNRYPLLKKDQPDRYLELKMAIYNNGILNPLTLWEHEGKLVILAGHNRQSICKEIIAECKEESGFDEEKFRYPPCIVYGEDEITEEQAIDIINDTNLYRDFSKLPSKVRIQITKERMELYKRRRYARGERIDQLARELGLEKTAVYENLSIYEKVIGPLQELYYDEKLTRKAILRFVFFDTDTQKWIYETYGDSISEAKVKALKKNMSRADIARVFEQEGKGIKRITVEVPVGREKEFRDMFSEWLRREPLE